MVKNGKNIWIGILGVSLVAALTWGIISYRSLQEYKLTVENSNRRAFAEFASQLDQLETDMVKQDVANSSSQRVLYLSKIATLSSSAASDLAQLPAEQAGLSYIGQFLTQTGEFTGLVAQKTADKGAVTPEDEKSLTTLRTTMQSVNTTVQSLAARTAAENLSWLDEKPSLWQRLGFDGPKVANATAEGQEASAKSVRSGLDQLDASLQKLPPFTYEGEYSSRTVGKPLGLPQGSVNQQQAQKIAQEFLTKVGYAGANPEFAGETQGDLGGFAWNYKEAYLEICRQGGAVVIYRDQRPSQIRTMDLAAVKKQAGAILQSLGWGLVITSTEDFGSYVNVEAVAEESGIRIYPDKVRLVIGTDNGQLLGLDATPYYAFHQKRNLNKGLSLDQARSKLRSGFEIKENRLAVVSVPNNKEVLCYEFRGVRNQEEYLIYINAINGNEEKIDRIIQTPRGEYLK